MIRLSLHFFQFFFSIFSNNKKILNVNFRINREQNVFLHTNADNDHRKQMTDKYRQIDSRFHWFPDRNGKLKIWLYHHQRHWKWIHHQKGFCIFNQKIRKKISLLNDFLSCLFQKPYQVNLFCCGFKSKQNKKHTDWFVIDNDHLSMIKKYCETFQRLSI